MRRNNQLFVCMLLAGLIMSISFITMANDNTHWSREFKKPASSTKMSGQTGMSDGSGKPTIKMAKWHKGQLYMAGRWANSLNPNNSTKRESNTVWYLWTWNPEKGYEAIAWQRKGKGGQGPEGIINDFAFLPDGRLVTGGEFSHISNLYGHSFHRTKGLAAYNPKEETANRWAPLVQSVQHNGPGSVQTVAYDPKGNDLWVGGSFSGFRMEEMTQFCFGVQKYDFDTKQWNIMVPGLRGGRGLRKIKVDTSTTPSTIYMAGRFSHTGGNGKEPRETSSTDRYSEGFCAWQEGTGWITFPAQLDKSQGNEGPLQRAADYAFFDSVNVLDFLVDGKDIWIVGAFSEGKNNNGPLRGIAKWDHEKQIWIDPTGKGGLGREAYAITKTADGKIYVAGAFGAAVNSSKTYDGFKNGDQAAMAICYDPATKEWSQLGDGLSGISMPVCRVTSVGNDVFFYGDFKQIGKDKTKGIQSYYLARWNSAVDFTAETPMPQNAQTPMAFSEPDTDKPQFTEGLEHWSRVFIDPPRMSGGKTKQSGKTGMDDGNGTPTIKAMTWHGDTLYVGGSWEVMRNERWSVWTYHKEKGWNPLGYSQKAQKTGWTSPPEGLAWHDNKLYVWGSNDTYKGIATWDPATNEWASVKGTYNGKPVIGNGVVNGNPAINDVKWDSKTGDMYMVGSTGLRYETGHPGGTVPSSVIRVDKAGNYHAMGHMLLAQVPSKPIKGIYCAYLDETKSPVDIYIGGTFGFRGADSNHKNLVFNVAKWDYELNDWGPIGKGCFHKIGMHDKKIFSEGYPGLPAQPINGFKTFLQELFGRTRCITMDKDGNLYAGGSIGILDDNPDITRRVEAYGLVKYDKNSDTWVTAAKCKGVSRDVFNMTWLDDTNLLLSGGFLYSEDFKLLNNIAVLNVKTGELKPIGGGLYKGSNAHVYSSNVVHTVNEEGYWFGGFFQYAGADINSRAQGAIESNYIAHYNPKKNMDPNQGLILLQPEPVPGPKGPSSESRKVQLKAQGVDASNGTVIWYKKQNRKFKKMGQGLQYNANIRVKQGMDSITFYGAVKTNDGLEGSKIPVTVKIQ